MCGRGHVELGEIGPTLVSDQEGPSADASGVIRPFGPRHHEQRGRRALAAAVELCLLSRALAHPAAQSGGAAITTSPRFASAFPQPLWRRPATEGKLMDDELVFTQRRFGTSLEHRLGPDSLTYSVRDLSGAVQYTVKYEAIIADQPFKFLVKNQLFFKYVMRALAASLVVPSILLIMHNNLAYPTLVLWAFIFAALYCSFSMNLFAIDYTMMKMNPIPPGMSDKAAIRVINDKDGSSIINAIQTRWKERLRRLHAEINFSNDATKEVAKFNWLKDHSVITADECREAIEKVQAMAARTGDYARKLSAN